MLNLLFGKRRMTEPATSDYWPGGKGRRTRAGSYVNEDIALTYAAVWCATRVLSEPIGSVPLFTYKRDGEDRSHATALDLYDLLRVEPAPGIGSSVWREGRTVGQVNWGNGFAEIERNVRDRVAALHPIHPSRVSPARPDMVDKGYRYLVRNNDGTTMPLRADEMLHIPGALSEDGIWGKGVIAHARESIGTSIATERAGATQFNEGNVPRIIVVGPGLKDKEARKNFREEWKTIHGSPDSGEVGILPTESKIEKLNFSNRDSQFLESQAFNRGQIATWYRIPPHMIGDLARATFSNIEQQSLEFVTYSLLPWIRRWEEQLTLKLFTREERSKYFVEFQLNGLLRGDLKTRMDSYLIAFRNGFMTLNEIRRLENLNGIGPMGDVHFVSLDMVPINRAMEPQQATKPDSFDFSSEDPEQSEREFDAFTRRLAGAWKKRKALVRVEGNGHV